MKKKNLFSSIFDIRRKSSNKIVSFVLFHILDFLFNIIDEFSINFFKTKIIERLKKARKEIENQWDSFYFKSYKILIYIIN